MNQNLGVIIEQPQPSGVGKFLFRNPMRDWLPFEPNAEWQLLNHVDVMACVSYSLCHIIETQIFFLTGKKVDLSERFLAKMSKTTRQGNYLSVVADTALEGLVMQDEWPVDPNATWDEFYSEIPQAIKNKALDFKKNWDMSWRWITFDQITDALKEAPIQIIINNNTHAVELVNSTTYFDSYAPFNKPFSAATYFLLFTINPKNMNQTKLVLSKDGHTVYRCEPIATTFDDLKAQMGVIGVEIPNPIPPSSSL
ncbi:MAG TPA: hypothetical protein VF974_04915 [Patescibacteria group bacterium]